MNAAKKFHFAEIGFYVQDCHYPSKTFTDVQSEFDWLPYTKVTDERLRNLNLLLDLNDVSSTEDTASASCRASQHDRLSEGKPH